MSKSKYLFLLFICLSASISIRAQFMDYGSDPCLLYTSDAADE